jgi:hypothetical protein
MALSGACLCGAIRYESDADPIAAYLCHCTDCQHASGGPYTACTLVAKDALRIAGEPARFEHPGGSGEIVCREFCSTCGSQLFSNSRTNPDWIALRSGTLDEPGAAKPTLHIWTCSALEWALPDDGAKRFAKGPRDE